MVLRRDKVEIGSYGKIGMFRKSDELFVCDFLIQWSLDPR